MADASDIDIEEASTPLRNLDGLQQDSRMPYEFAARFGRSM